MKNIILLTLTSVVLFSCAPVLNRDIMKEGMRDVSLSSLKDAPDAYKGRLYILGGVIVETKLTEKGSQIEALFVPVNKYGYLREPGHKDGRFLAVFPQASGLLDPLIYKKGREITLAGAFIEARKGKIDEMEYTYPVFEIKQIYLWEERREYYYAPYYYYPYYYPYPYIYDPWWRPYPPYWYGPPKGW